jgi:hypothetical protein
MYSVFAQYLYAMSQSVRCCVLGTKITFHTENNCSTGRSHKAISHLVLRIVRNSPYGIHLFFQQNRGKKICQVNRAGLSLGMD